MSVREILKMGDARLLQPARRVEALEWDSDALHLLVADLWDTMHAHSGAGLAAPQIGVNLQVVVFGSGQPNPRYPDRPLVPQTVLINPVITPLAPPLAPPDAAPLEELDWEGCLSVPGLRGQVPRWQRIQVQGFDVYGDPLQRTVEGFHARVVQHECDHLFGILYPMRLRDLRAFGYTEVLFPELAPSRP